MKRWNRYNKALLATLTGVCLWGSSCQEEAGVGSALQQEREIRLTATYPCQTQTRATDAGFADGDAVGIFVMDYVGDTPEAMALQGNRASNVKFAYQDAAGSWTSATTLFWGNMPADFIGYYPFNESLESVTEHHFEVATDQNRSATDVTLGGYEASDLLWAKTANVEPAAETVQLQYNHLMAGVTIRLERGEGFTDAEWVDAEKIIRVCSTVPSAKVNLSTGTVTVSTEKSVDILPYAYNAEWRAVIVPQSVEAGKALIALTVDGQNYVLTKQETINYLSGKMHTFTIEVQKREVSGEYTFTLLDEGVTAWLDDSDFRDGIVREYLSIELKEPGTLAEHLTSIGQNYRKVKALKVKGVVNHEDLYFMGQKMTSLNALNLKDVIITGNEDEKDVLTGFNMDEQRTSSLQHFVFPTQLKKIADCAFRNSSLVGSLIIPEGVEYIGTEAFVNNKGLSGKLSLPSTLKVLRGGSFAWTQLQGELLLPDALEILGPRFYGGQNYSIFAGCSFTGEFHFPANLKEYSALNLSGMTGHIVIPQGITYVPEFGHENSHCTSLEMPEGITRIEAFAFRGSKIQGEVKIPSTCREIGNEAFKGSRLSKIIWHDDLILGEYIFAECHYLQGVVSMPQNITRIPAGTFQNCSLITGIELHEEITTIGEYAFNGCQLLDNIVCYSEEPPLIGEGAFDGVPKSNITVQVPASAFFAYKQADGWREFKRITIYNDFMCQPSKVCALNKSRSQSLVLYTDKSWTVEHLPDWCRISKKSGTGKTELTLTVHKMPHGVGNRTDSIVFRLDDMDYTTYCKVSQYDYEYEEDEKITLQTHTQGKGIDIIFLGDGYDGEAHSKGEFLNLIKEQVEYFFGVEPYKSHRSYFNVYAVVSLSQETGVNTLNTYRDTYFGTIYAGSEKQLMPDAGLVINYVQNIFPKTNLSQSQLILVPNTTEYGGCTTIMSDGTPISICPRSIANFPQDTRGVIQHEACGHGFGKLGDERVCINRFIPMRVESEIRRNHEQGWFQNLSVTSKMSEVPWADFIFDPRYSNEVDVFEGGALYTRGVYRCELNSCMNYGIPYFNVMSRLDIMRRILTYAGKTFTMDYFYAHDSKEWGESSLNTTRTPWQEMPEVNSGWGGFPMIVDDWNALSNEVKRLREEAKRKNNR